LIAWIDYRSRPYRTSGLETNALGLARFSANASLYQQGSQFMHKLVVSSLLAGSAALLSACSGGTEEAAVDGEAAAPAPTETVAAAPAAPTVVDANTATEQQLAGLPGMTPEIAAALVAARPYADVVAFEAALRKTMAPEAARSALTQVFVPVNLNTASEDAIKLIPGMTPKMVDEFLEYRPYADMAEFDREIGKYIDEAEVARLRAYVTL
jgi:DNA uptake protein ComE-like DNA-binding protein